MLRDPLDNAVVSIDSLVKALQSLNPIVLDDLESQLETSPHLLQLAEHTVGDVGNDWKP